MSTYKDVENPISDNGMPHIHPKTALPFDDFNPHLILPSLDRPHWSSQTLQIRWVSNGDCRMLLSVQQRHLVTRKRPIHASWSTRKTSMSSVQSRPPSTARLKARRPRPSRGIATDFRLLQPTRTRRRTGCCCPADNSSSSGKVITIISRRYTGWPS